MAHDNGAYVGLGPVCREEVYHDEDGTAWVAANKKRAARQLVAWAFGCPLSATKARRVHGRLEYAPDGSGDVWLMECPDDAEGAEPVWRVDTEDW